MQLYEILRKKRDGAKLSENEIIQAVIGYTVGSVPDYKMAALLMAIVLRGMDTDETFYLTKAMLDSGETMNFPEISGVKTDKHSTGGVGDGISLVLAPLVASAGGVVTMMSGRGLGHTGGTLDKLESIPGFSVNRPHSDLSRQLERIRVFMIGQSDKIAPADKKMYALRDVTATVDSIPLIAASIMSKKLSEGCDALVLDVKTGSGAFMQKKSDAVTLAETMIDIGKKYGKKISALITNMNQPLGNCIGNALEIKQAINILKDKEHPKDFLDLVYALGSRMLVMGKVCKDITTAKTILNRNLKNGFALDTFREIISFQGGNPGVIDNPDKLLPSASQKEEIFPKKTGYIASIDTKAVGYSSVLLGAGRKSKEDNIDHAAGIVIHKKLGDRVETKEPIATFYFNDASFLNKAKDIFTNAYTVSNNKPKRQPLVLQEIK
ncbi:MAG: thymidine phosphorylase [Endomicrobiales bacterium]|nr:thymidine phosphorylase [Endomicrobiales bacterium]